MDWQNITNYLSARTAPTFENIVLAVFILCVVAVVIFLDSN